MFVLLTFSVVKSKVTRLRIAFGNTNIFVVNFHIVLRALWDVLGPVFGPHFKEDDSSSGSCVAMWLWPSAVLTANKPPVPVAGSWLLHNLVWSATCRGCRWHLWRCTNAIIWALSLFVYPFSFHAASLHLHSSGAQRYQPNNSILNNGKYFTTLPDIATTIVLSAQQHSVNAFYFEQLYCLMIAIQCLEYK